MRSRVAIAPMLATVLIVAAALIATAAILGYVFGIFGYSNNVLSASVEPNIFAPSQNIAVLNDKANFTVNLTNLIDATENGTVRLLGGGQVVYSRAFSIPPAGRASINFTQELFSTGEWTFMISSSGGTIFPYSFQVVLNSDQASLMLDQLQSQQDQSYLSYVALTIAIAAVIPAYVGLYLRRTDKRPEFTVTRFRDGENWIVRVRCSKGLIEQCMVYFGADRLPLDGSGSALKTETVLGRGEQAAFLAGPISKIGRDDRRVYVSDGGKVIFEKPFGDLKQE